MEMAANNNLAVESSYSNVFELSGEREMGGSQIKEYWSKTNSRRPGCL